jgi:hypothetical protein
MIALGVCRVLKAAAGLAALALARVPESLLGQVGDDRLER